MVHFIYPYDFTRIAAPWSIGNNVAQELYDQYGVVQYDWTDTGTIEPGDGDILLGHPHPNSGFIFTNSMQQDGWSKVVAMTPWGGLTSTVKCINKLLPDIDALALICGPFWANQIPPSWRHKTTALDMAIKREDYPPIKGVFNSRKSRRILYIGCTEPSKGTWALEQLSRRLPYSFAHAGYGQIDGVRSLGYLDFTAPDALDVLRQFDFVICPGTNDANPTVVLEALSWGLIPLATELSGWGEDICVRLPATIDGMIETIQQLQDASEGDLVSLRAKKRSCLDRYNWQRFTSQIENLFQ